ncbi:glucose PTS transporter subunit IIA [Paenibacillus alvei]|uniref:glucose PTS transporter subunit IIA n=1 Tax=Paenibacillus TaxID=44249 RepID=UPI000289D00A|nr:MULTISPECIES: glucose PTS transporter subunit IIA [Paenibacillus]EJW17476.1 putative PTS system glucosamine-specific EIICBA component GamP [Paenibacillus alvei DSM 29]MCY7487089.1 glucose PTS transporter subunit IIA [Paenibacillus alvei]MCY9540353.1 glucose PTS transporter subunit IIA [Paenibacillus alvei]MCY9705878.1 glucose PTS transporter subunit IIA [Paenibacillus alvei]MCY9737039.1 glucose PTS transporter subunit IIA [Paenibacillus alvei]
MNQLGRLQQLSRALMQPLIALPAAALAIAIGNLLHSAGLSDIAILFELTGKTVFSVLPYIFAVGVALGLSNNAGVAALSSLLGMFIFKQLLVQWQASFEPTILNGILFGVMAGFLHERFKNIKMPEYLQFFGGPRFVIAITIFASILLSWFMKLCSPFLQQGVMFLGQELLAMGGFGVFLYGVMHRVLVAFGLHHLLNNVYWFQIGTFTNSEGMSFTGDLPRFFAGDPSAGIYMAGMYPIMMFALPAVALAIVHESREDLRPKVRKTYFTAACVSLLTGITEPIEFAFLFAAPYLFVVHALLTGAAMWLTAEIGVRHGFSFSAGAIDYVVNFHQSTKGLWIIPIGIAFGFIYYVVFRYAIQRFQIPTPGRVDGSLLDDMAGDLLPRVPLIIRALGGKDNIIDLQACITRLRLRVKNDKLVDRHALRVLGAAGVIRLGGGHIQVVFGTYSELIKDEMAKRLQRDPNQIWLVAPVHGRMIPIEEVPDKIFAQKLVGQGVAFYPDKGELVSPVRGHIRHIYPTMHAIGIETPEGLEVLLHIGIETSSLNGAGFQAVVQEGDEVKPGQLLIKFDLPEVKKRCKSLATPMVITNSDAVASWSIAPFAPVRKGQTSVMSVIMHEHAVGGASR